MAESGGGAAAPATQEGIDALFAWLWDVYEFFEENLGLNGFFGRKWLIWYVRKESVMEMVLKEFVNSKIKK